LKLAEPDDLLSEKSTVILSHGNEQISWNISMLARTRNEENLDRFKELNGYWARLPEKRQDEIFKVYTDIKDVLHSSSDQNAVALRLQPLVAKLFKLNPMDEMATYLAIYEDLKIPSNIHEHYDSSGDSRNSEQGTYVTKQYRDLVTMSVTLRIMVPVWGDYIAITERLAGTTFKEFIAMQLLAHAAIYNSDTMNRLREYIQARLPPETPKEVIFQGISSEDFPDWILARILTRRLVVADLRGNDVKKSLMPFLHSFIEGMVNPKRNNFTSMIKEKTLEAGGSTEDSNLSILEGYRPRAELTAGNIAHMATYTRNAERMAKRICPDLPEELLAYSLRSSKALLTQMIMPVQLSLASWILRPVLPVRALPYFRKVDVVRCIAVAQALLWHRGHYELAGLVSGVAQQNQGVHHQRSTGSRGRIPTELIDEIHRLYPYSEKPTGKIREGQDTRELNMVVQSIKEIDGLFTKFEWTLTLPPEWVEKLTKNKNNRNYSVPHEMRVRLASLIAAIAKRSF
jgi:hypothetical protein